MPLSLQHAQPRTEYFIPAQSQREKKTLRLQCCSSCNASLCWVPDSLSFKPAKCLQLSVTVFFKRLIEALIHLFILTSFGHFYWKNGFCPSLGHCLVLASTLPWCGDFISFLKTKGGWNCKTLWRFMSKWRILSEKFITYHPIYWNREWCQGGCQYLPEIK